MGKRVTQANCVVCSKEVKRKPNKFCSNKCCVDFKYYSNVYRWLTGRLAGLNGVVVARYVRRWLYETRGEQCELCGWHEINIHTGKIPVEIHHKDGDYTNNTPENLEIICPSCHSLTKTYKNLNTGNGRKSRHKPL